MNRFFAIACCGLAMCLTPLTSRAADEKPKGQVIEAKPSQQTCATGVDFGKELGVAFPDVSTLGARIEAARSAPDPVGLASAAKDLSVLEKVSGKTCAIKSAELAKEAVDLAKHRNQSAELKAVGLLLDTKDLEEQAEKASKTEAAAQSAKASGTADKARGIQRFLHVDNRTPQAVRVYIDGIAVGWVGPFGDGVILVGQGAFETTVLDGRGTSGGVWHSAVSSPVGDFTWSLLP